MDLIDDEDSNAFEHLISPLLPDFIQQRKVLQANEIEMDAYVCTLFYVWKDVPYELSIGSIH